MMLLLDKGATLEARDRAQNTPLHRGVRPRNNDATAFLIERGADVKAVNDRGRTPLHVAATILRTDVIKQLLAAGASTDARDRDGATPFVLIGANYTATKNDHRIKKARETVESMLAGGADINEADGSGQTLLHRIARRGPLSSEEMVGFLLKQGADPTIRDADGKTARDFAIANSSDAIAKLLG